MKHSIKTVVRQLPLILFILVILFSGFMAYYFAYHITNSDTSSEFILAKLLANQNKIVSSDWLYSTEMRVFNTNLIYMPLMKIFEDWHVARFLSIIIFQIMLLLSYFYLCRRIKISLNAYFLSASLMFLPFGVAYGRMILYYNFYTPCVIYGFLIVGLYLAFMENLGQNRLRQIFRLAALLLLSMMSCLNGFRQFPATMIPLLMTALVIAIWNRRGTTGILADIPGKNWKGVCIAGAAFAVGTVGLFIYAKIFSRYFFYKQMDDILVALPTVKNLRNILLGYLGLFGFQEERALFSVGGLLSIASVPAAIILLIVSLSEFLPRNKSNTFLGAFRSTMYPVAMLCMTVTFLLLTGYDYYPNYYLTAFVWIFPYLGLKINSMPYSFKRFTLKQTLLVLSCVCLLLSGVYTNLYYLNPGDNRESVDHTHEIEWDHFAGVIEFVKENDLEVGYATFWNANILTEISNGQIPMIPLIRDYSPNNYIYHYALTNKHSFELSYIEDKSVFLMLTYSESFIFFETELAQFAIPVYEDDYFRIYMFDFSSDVWEYFQNLDKVYLQ